MRDGAHPGLRQIALRIHTIAAIGKLKNAPSSRCQNYNHQITRGSGRPAVLGHYPKDYLCLRSLYAALKRQNEADDMQV